MKKHHLFFLIFLPFISFAQVHEDFSDGDFTHNPEWTGTYSHFFINTAYELQSCAPSASVSYLFTPSQAIENATWECRVRINYPTSAANYASFYLLTDRNDRIDSIQAYYVQIGGTNDEVSLYLQQGTRRTRIIDGVDKRTDGNPVELTIRVTRDKEGIFKLYSKKAKETDFIQEGSVRNLAVTRSQYIAVLYSNTSTTGSAYIFDDIHITGEKGIDETPPEWETLSILLPDKLLLTFSEPMNFTHAQFEADNDMGQPVARETGIDNKSITLSFASEFRTGKLYTLFQDGLTDEYGNKLTIGYKKTGIVEKADVGDLLLNEIMFENPENSVEYIEVYNTSEKILDLAQVVCTTRKTDGTLNTGNPIPYHTLLAPQACMAFCSDAELLCNYYGLNPENMVTVKWTTLNNESATVVLANSTKETIYDELTYSSKWHHPGIKNKKGVALERINPGMPTQDRESWHSASFEVNYGTPGYKNSQYREIVDKPGTDKMVWIEPETFSPDNDGIDDVCFIHYKTEVTGYAATIQIFNLNGIKMVQLASNALLSGHGFMIWDGLDEHGKNVNPGIYVVYVQLVNQETGHSKNFKLPVVLSTR